MTIIKWQNLCYSFDTGIVQGGFGCGNEHLPKIFIRLNDFEILQFVKEKSGMIKCKLFYLPECHISSN